MFVVVGKRMQEDALRCHSLGDPVTLLFIVYFIYLCDCVFVTVSVCEYVCVGHMTKNGTKEKEGYKETGRVGGQAHV